MNKGTLFLIACMSMLLIGCGKQEASPKADIAASIPEWIASYMEMEQYPETIYLDEESDAFSIENNRLVFPESNLLIVTKKLAGQNMEAVTDSKDEMMTVFQLLKEEEVLTEEETVNPNGKVIDLDYDIVLLTVSGEYILVEFTVFEDHRVLMDITCENEDNSMSVWVKSKKIAEKIKMICGYQDVDLSAMSEIERVEICIADGTTYTLAEEDTKKLADILTDLKEEASLCSGPYDISIKGIGSGKEWEMSWCNDGCGILAIQGKCYQLEEEDIRWLQGLIDKIEE